jgi:hypothetical protein
MSLPNVHIGLHLANMTYYYSTIFNCNVLTGLKYT